MSCKNPQRRAMRPVETQLLGQHAGEMRDFDRVPAYVLAVADAEIEPSHQLDELFVQTGGPGFLCRLESEVADAVVHFLLCFADDLFDAARMDPAVLNQFDHRQLGDLAADVVEGRNDDHARGIVDDHVDARLLLEGADVAALAANDAALHLVVGNVDGRDGGFGGVRGGVALNRHGQHFARLAVALRLEVVLEPEDQRAGFVLELPLEPLEQHFGAGLLIQTADLVELFLLLRENAFELAFADFEGLAAVGQLVLRQLEHPFLFLDVVDLLVEHDFATVELAFDFAELFARILDLALHRFAAFEQVLLGGQLVRLEQVARLDLGLLDDFVPSAVTRSLADPLEQQAGADTRTQTDQPDQQISNYAHAIAAFRSERRRNPGRPHRRGRPADEINGRTASSRNGQSSMVPGAIEAPGTIARPKARIAVSGGRSGRCKCGLEPQQAERCEPQRNGDHPRLSRHASLPPPRDAGDD